MTLDGRQPLDLGRRAFRAASAEEVRTRFSVEAAKALGDRHARQIEEVIDAIEHQNDVSELARLLASG